MSLYVGFDREDITPTNGGIPLAGYGATHLRLAAEVIDRLYVNVIALGNEKPEFIFATCDLINVREYYLTPWREAISARTGVPKEQIMIGGTHTHSAPDYWSAMESIKTYFDTLPEILADAAARAVRDMLPAKIRYGRDEVGTKYARFNFVKHYKMAKKSDLEALGLDVNEIVRDCSWEEKIPAEYLVDAGDNYGDQYSSNPEYVYVGHEETADPEMQVVEFVRENADNIVIVNFQTHATVTGGSKKTKMSSDFVGPMRERLEAVYPHSKAVFYQGAAGNINTNTRIASEGIYGLTFGMPTTGRDHRAYGSVIGSEAFRILTLYMKDSESDTLDFMKYVMVQPHDHSLDDRVDDAAIIREAYLKEGNTPEVRALCAQYGFNSPYHATSAISKKRASATGEIEMNVLRIGDLGMITAPCEMFNRTGLFIKEHSPFPMTIVKAYSTGSVSYMPTENAYWNAYEWNQTAFIKGTAERMGDKYVEMLTELYNRKK